MKQTRTGWRGSEEKPEGGRGRYKGVVGQIGEDGVELRTCEKKKKSGRVSVGEQQWKLTIGTFAIKNCFLYEALYDVANRTEVCLDSLFYGCMLALV